VPDQASGILSPWLRKRRINAVKPYLQGKILDFGCGVGVLAGICGNENYTGVDIDEESVKIAKASYPDLEFTCKLPEDEQFDVVVMMAIIEHIDDPIELLKKFSALLKPNGKIVLTTPHPSVEAIHTFGSKIKLFSSNAAEEHENLFDRKSMNNSLEKAGLNLLHYKRFLFGANQLFIAGFKDSNARASL
jgi:2-polyprenyl-3-methyl-5-hydroxy-6-metoxy-1,4-benzoquinol methylase